MPHDLTLIRPNWPVPHRVQAVMTTRLGGFSQGAFSSFNLAHHVGDESVAVIKNRHLLKKTLSLPSDPLWLNQQHTATVIEPHDPTTLPADAIYTTHPNHVCVIMTADCLPILLCNQTGTEIAAIHGGWRSLAQGIIAHTLSRFHSKRDQILAWLGPAIGPCHFYVGKEVVDAFSKLGTECEKSFILLDEKSPTWSADLNRLATILLNQAGVYAIFSDARCTYDEASLFYSYRRDKRCGRMASLIWIIEH